MQQSLLALALAALSLPACAKQSPEAPKSAAEAPKSAAEAPKAAASQVDPALAALLEPAITLQEILSADKTEGVAQAAQALAKAAETHGKAELAQAAKALGGTDLKADREAFKAVGALMRAAVLADPVARTEYAVVHCPMAPGDWVQRGRAVRNPYHGSEMLACGSIVNRDALKR